MILYYVTFPLAFFLVANSLLRRDPLLAVAFLVALRLFLQFLLFKTMPEIAFAAGTFINLTIAALFLRAVATRPWIMRRHASLVIAAGIVLLLAYLVALALLRGDDPVAYVMYVRNFFFNLALLVVFLAVPGRRPRDVRFYVRLVVVLMGVQVFLGLAQFADRGVSDFFKVMQYERLGEIQQALPEVFENQKVVIGTLRSMQNVSSFILLNVVFLLALKVIARSRTPGRRPLIGAVVMGIMVMILAGVRAPMIGLMIGFGLLVWQRARLAVIVAVVVAVVAVPPIMSAIAADLDYATTVDAGRDVERPIQRIVGAFAILDADQLRFTTVRRTLALSEELRSGWLFGSGPGIVFTDYSVTDAFLVLLVVEFGIAGLALLLLPYVYTLRLLAVGNGPKVARAGAVLLLVALSQSVVNEGLWADFANAYYMFLIMVLFRVRAREDAAVHFESEPPSERAAGYVPAPEATYVRHALPRPALG